ncbi:MAG: phospho-sugar mutase, partial [Planctomycetota bacterium]
PEGHRFPMGKYAALRRRLVERGVLSQDEVLAAEPVDRDRLVTVHDAAYVDAAVSQSTSGPRDLKIVYSPLHGVGASAVCPVLQRAGFADVELFARHAEPDGDFPNVPGHVSNPENPAIFDAIAARAGEAGADVALATDPDCDRIGCSTPLTFAGDAPWQTFTGNQIGALIVDHLLESRHSAGALTPEHYVVETLVTTQLVRRIAESYGVRTVDNLLVGFKWIAGVMDELGPEKFVFGTEESHGYLAGRYARDKDGGVASMLLCEAAAKLKASGQTLHEKLDALFWQHGAHAERTVSVQMPGSEGMDRMKEVMARYRTAPPNEIAGSGVAQVRDYLSQTTTPRGGSPQPLDGPCGDLVILDLEAAGNYVAIRPSGTEPKIKLYLFTFEPPEQLANLEDAKQSLQQRLDAMQDEMRVFAGV